MIGFFVYPMKTQMMSYDGMPQTHGTIAKAVLMILDIISL